MMFFTAEAREAKRKGYWLQSKPEAYEIHEDWYRCVKKIAQSQNGNEGIYTKTNKNSRGMNPAIKQECIGKNERSADERINSDCGQNGTHHGMWHSAAVPLHYSQAGRGDVLGQADQDGGWGHIPHHLDPRIFSEPDRIKALPAPSPPLLQHLHIIELNQLLRRGRRPLHPTLPTLTS
jgi:hypothetical protein